MLHQATAAGFAFGVGFSVGSFLNVCVWRLPRGMSLIRPASRCPGCGTPIAARDNLPILGWILLRGRCRSCKAPISLRYPIVEAGVGFLFAAVMLAEIAASPTDLLDQDPWWVLARLLYEWALLALLVTAALIDRDGARLKLPAVSIGVLATFAVALCGPFSAPLNVGLLAVYVRGRRR
jgi:leader peptidase (prepilin peptidase)/N-methyltransferase